MWWDILKMGKPIMPGSDFKSSEEYNRGTREQKMAYHSRMREAARINLKILQRRMTGATTGLSNVDPVVDEDPVNQEIDQLQELYRFHNRQYIRLSRGTKETFFSFEEENNREKKIPQTTRTGSRIVHKEIPQEEYDELSQENKLKYHKRLANKYEIEGNEKLRKFHQAMRSRLSNRRENNLPTFSSFRENYRRVRGTILGEFTKEGYLQMSDKDKMRYHNMMRYQEQVNGRSDLAKWYGKMAHRLGSGSKLPTYFSPEHEQEETQ